MLQPLSLLPHVDALVDGFVHVIAVPTTRCAALDGAERSTRDVSFNAADYGCGPDGYRLFTADGVRLCAFRDRFTAARVASTLGSGLLSLPSGFPEMILRTSLLATGLWYAEARYPGVPYSEIPSDLSRLAGMPYATLHDRAVAVLASTALEHRDVEEAVVWAAAVTDAYGLDDGFVHDESDATHGELLIDSRRRGRDTARIRSLAQAYSQARRQYPDVPVSALLGRHVRWESLRHATPRTRAIALAAVAVGSTRGVWDVDRAVALIDGADLSTMTAILQYASRDAAAARDASPLG